MSISKIGISNVETNQTGENPKSPDRANAACVLVLFVDLNFLLFVSDFGIRISNFGRHL
jgi:hypothetical protein